MDAAHQVAIAGETTQRAPIALYRCEHELIRRDGTRVIVMVSEVVKDSPSDPMVRRRCTNIPPKRLGWRQLNCGHANVIGAASEEM